MNFSVYNINLASLKKLLLDLFILHGKITADFINVQMKKVSF